MVKSEELVKLLSDERFACSTGWVDRFTFWHNSCWKVSGEARALNCEATAEWLSTVWPKLRQRYSHSDIFNSDKTERFFWLTQ